MIQLYKYILSFYILFHYGLSQDINYSSLMLCSRTLGFIHFYKYQFASVAYFLLWSRIVESGLAFSSHVSSVFVRRLLSLSLHETLTFRRLQAFYFVDCPPFMFVWCFHKLSGYVFLVGVLQKWYCVLNGSY